MPTIHLHFSSWLITSNCTSILIVFRWFFTPVALGDANLGFSFMLARKANAVEEKIKWAAWLFHHLHQSIHVTDGMTVMSLPAGLLQKITATTECLWQTNLNQKLLHKFKKWCKFLSRVTAKSRKNKLCRTRPASVLEFYRKWGILLFGECVFCKKEWIWIHEQVSPHFGRVVPMCLSKNHYTSRHEVMQRCHAQLGHST